MKKVRFSDNVDVKYMDVTLEEHSREVKNPIGYQESLLKKTLSFDKKESVWWISWWVWLLIVFVIVLIFIYFIWKIYFKKNNKETEELNKSSVN